MKISKQKILIKHDKNCYAVKNTRKKFWDTPWAFVKETKIGSRKSPYRKGHTLWSIVICNNTKCPAKIGLVLK